MRKVLLLAMVAALLSTSNSAMAAEKDVRQVYCFLDAEQSVDVYGDINDKKLVFDICETGRKLGYTAVYSEDSPLVNPETRSAEITISIHHEQNGRMVEINEKTLKNQNNEFILSSIKKML